MGASSWAALTVLVSRGQARALSWVWVLAAQCPGPALSLGLETVTPPHNEVPGQSRLWGRQAGLGAPGMGHLGDILPGPGTSGVCRAWVPRAPSGPQVDFHQPPHGVHAVEDPQRQAKVDNGEPRPVAIEVLFQPILKLGVDAESRHHP